MLKTVWKSEFQNTSKSLRELVENSDLWRFPLACYVAVADITDAVVVAVVVADPSANEF